MCRPVCYTAGMMQIKRLTLPAYGFAKNLDPERRQLLAICGEFWNFEAGETIVQEGETHTELFLVLEGTLVLRRRIDEHAYAPIGTAKRGSSFGEMNLFHPQPSRTTIQAATAGELWKIRREQFDAMLADDLLIAREALSYLCQSLATRLRRATERYVNAKEEYNQIFDELIEEQAEHQESPTPAEPPSVGEAVGAVVTAVVAAAGEVLGTGDEAAKD